MIKQTALPEGIANLPNLKWLNLDRNPLTDLSPLQALPEHTSVTFFGVEIPKRFRTSLTEWQSKCLLSDRNSEICQVLFDRVSNGNLDRTLATLSY